MNIGNPNNPDGLAPHKLQRPVFAYLPCGKLATRRSVRKYTHVVAVKGSAGWRVLCWCGSADRAKAQTYRAKGLEARIVAVFE